MEKKFDAVQTMRAIRDQLTAQFKDMTFEEQKRCMQKQARRRKTSSGRMRRGEQPNPRVQRTRLASCGEQPPGDDECRANRHDRSSNPPRR